MIIPLTQDEPLYRQIYSFLRSGILSGRLPSGTQLPSSRAWAAELHVSRTVVLLAFDQLIAEGYIKGVRGFGTVVCDDIPSDLVSPNQDFTHDIKSSTPPILSQYATRLLSESEVAPAGPVLIKNACRYDFHYGNRRAIDFPHKVWQRLASRCMSRALPTRGPTAGYPPLREAIAEHLRRTRAVRCEPEQIVMVSGSQQALDLLAKLLVNPGDHVVIEDPQYHGARQAFRAVGAQLLPCAVDDDGLCVHKLPRDDRRARVVFVTPSHQFPTGAVLPLPRRLALIEWAERHNAFIIEDDYDGELRYDCRPIEAVQALDRAGRVVYLGTFSKALSPELRLGYVVVPPPLLKAFLAAKWVSDLFTSTLVQETLAIFMREGHYERHLRRLRERNAARRQALLEAIDVELGGAAIIAGAQAGLHALVWLPTVPLAELPALVDRAAQLGVAVYPVTNYYLGSPRGSGVLVSYASLMEEEIREGIRLFARALEQGRRTGGRSGIRRQSESGSTEKAANVIAYRRFAPQQASRRRRTKSSGVGQ